MTKTEFPNLSSDFLALLMGEKSAGLSQLYRAVTSSRTLHRAAAEDCLPLSLVPGGVLCRAPRTESNLWVRASSSVPHEDKERSYQSPEIWDGTEKC